MIKPLGNRIFIKQDPQPESKGSIILLKKEGKYAPPYAGTIIGIGDGINDNDYKIGSHVLFHDLAGMEIKYKDEIIISLREKEITAIIDKNVKVV